MNRNFIVRSVIAAVLLGGMIGCANTGQKTGAYVDDSWITAKVKSEMVASSETSARNIAVNTSKGAVTLTGTAATTMESEKAASIARGVKGVTTVSNEIVVQP